MNLSNTSKAILAALVSQVIFGFSFMFTKIALQYESPLVVIADRYFVAFVCMCVMMLVTRTKIHFTQSIGKLLIMALFQPVLYFLLETYGIRMTNSSFSSVMIAMIPVISMLGGHLFLKEIPTRTQYLFTIISVAGVVFITCIGTA